MKEEWVERGREGKEKRKGRGKARGDAIRGKFVVISRLCRKIGRTKIISIIAFLVPISCYKFYLRQILTLT